MFPISNWTELDIWQYIADEEIELPSIYFAHEREVFRARRHAAGGQRVRDRCMDGEEVFEADRSATAPSATPSCTGAVESTAATVDEVIAEVAATRITERGATRADDRFTEAAMEDRKREGYF